jgi:mono/diheme cytochrome c family protein
MHARAMVAAVAVPLLLAGVAVADEAQPRYAGGAETFLANCAVCHGPHGTGIPSIAPPLTHYPARYADSPEGRRQLAMTVLFGMFGDVTVDGKPYNFKMPDFSRFSDEVLADVLNFVVFDLGSGVPPTDGAPRAPLAPADIAPLREPWMSGEAVRAHRESLLPQLGL